MQDPTTPTERTLASTATKLRQVRSWYTADTSVAKQLDTAPGRRIRTYLAAKDTHEWRGAGRVNRGRIRTYLATGVDLTEG